jgi:hypothetical protein
MSNSSWAPDEDAYTLFVEKTWLQGSIVAGGSYGIVVCLSLSCIHALLFRPRSVSDYWRSMALSGYVVIVFIISTLFVVANSIMTQLAFIDNRNYPGGPSVWEDVMSSIPIDVVSNVTLVLANWFSDGMVVWRTIVIYRSSRIPQWLVILTPTIMFTGSFCELCCILYRWSALKPSA